MLFAPERLQHLRNLLCIRNSKMRLFSFIVMLAVPLIGVAIIESCKCSSFGMRAYIFMPICLAYWLFVFLLFVYISPDSAQEQRTARDLGEGPAVHICFWAAVPYAEAKVLRASPAMLKEMCFPVQFVYAAKWITGDSEVAGSSAAAAGRLGTRLEAFVADKDEPDREEEASVDRSTEMQPISSEESEKDPCPCCHEAFRDGCQVALLRCGHVFCEGCIKDWVCRSGSKVTQCPICRRSFATAGPETV